MTPLLFVIVLLGVLRVTVSELCACATTNVNVRSGPGTRHAILTTLMKDKCLPLKQSYRWKRVDYNGQDGWIYGRYVDIKACASGGSNPVTSAGGCPRIIPRSEWNARAPKSTSTFHGPARYAFIHHGKSRSCHTQKTCSRIVRSYQNYHMNSRGWSDIGYNFLVGEDGNVYEGRGWDTQGAHTRGYNSVGLGFCMIGNFQSHLPNEAALDALKRLLACGKASGKLRSNYILRGHRDMVSTDCPGQKLYALIQTWPHY